MSLVLTRRHNVDRFGYLIPTRYGNVPMVGAVATYRPGEGRFGGAVAVEEGTTNLEDPKTWSGWMIDASVTALSTYEHELTASGTPAGEAFVYKTFNFGGSALTFQVEIAGVGSTIGRRVMWQASQAGFWGTELVLTEEYKRLIATIGPVEGNVPVGIGVVEGLSAGEKVKLRYRQVEQKPFATSFVDGTRADGKLEYDINLPAENFTIAHWLRVPNDIAPLNGSENTWVIMYNILNDSGFSPSVSIGHWSMFSIRYASEPELYLYLPYPDDTGYGDWVYMVIVKQGHTMTMYAFNATRDTWSKEERTIPEDDSGWTTITQLKFRGARNILHDELLILPYAASEEEIRAWYEADGPIPPHPAALLQWDWQAVRPATMVAL